MSDETLWPDVAEPGTVASETITERSRRSPSVPRERGTETSTSVPRSPTPAVGNGEHATARLYADVSALLDGTAPEPPSPEFLHRSDGHALFYAGQVSLIFGDPESGKTWLCLAAVAEVLSRGRSAMVVDLDHNGPHATISRLLILGAPVSALRDVSRFRYAEPEDGIELRAIVEDAATWTPDVVVLDSVGEVVPLFGGSSNSPDDFTRVHSLVMKPLAMTGASVLCIDHLAKGADSRAQGSTGTAAKKRAIGGVSVRVTLKDAFTPGVGGAATIAVNKDRHGAVRAVCPTGDKEPYAGTFIMRTEADETSWWISAPKDGDRNPAEAVDSADLDALEHLDPPPTSVRDVKDRLSWRSERAADALREWRSRERSPVPHTGVGERGTPPGTCSVCTGVMVDLGDGATAHPTCEPASVS